MSKQQITEQQQYLFSINCQAHKFVYLKLGKAICPILDLLESTWSQHLHLRDNGINILGSLASHEKNASQLYRLKAHNTLTAILQESFNNGHANTVCQVFRFFKNLCHNTELAKLLGKDGIFLKVSHLVFQDFTVNEVWVKLVDLLMHFYKFIKDIPDYSIWVPSLENRDFVVRYTTVCSIFNFKFFLTFCLAKI